ncbi:MAG: hypothetical protein K8T10_14845 [Candidatus Eremiobacteraeota bacterium]|nr:hypothetical protein [Candidatus Eremiobacteraeota bacterium]
MKTKIDLRKLAGMTSSDRAFLSLYLSGSDSLEKMKKRIHNIRKLLKGKPDEHKHFEENLKMIENYFQKNPRSSGSICIFACWLLDYIEIIPLNVPVEDLIWIDSSPFILPLAEIQDEYENFVVVVADNDRARIYIVASGRAESEEKIKGNVKNHVKVGGWSQQRYERRRDNQMHHYAHEIVTKLEDMEKKEDFRRIVLVGSRETINEIHKAMPKHLLEKVIGEKALDLRKDDMFINKEIFNLFFADERKSEIDLWKKIKAHYMRGQLAVVGMEEVIKLANMGRVEKVIANRNIKFKGVRCRECEGLFPGTHHKCPGCGSDSVFEVDPLNELIEILASTSAEADLADEIPELSEVGGIAALLRY